MSLPTPSTPSLSKLWLWSALLIPVAVGSLFAMQQVPADQISLPGSERQAEESVQAPSVFPVNIRPVVASRGVTARVEATDGTEPTEVTLACATCHGQRQTKSSTGRDGMPVLFHQGLSFDHGRLSCVSCHNTADGYATLHLADGTALRSDELMSLCAQCHAQQAMNYQHGAHGGMSGHWDLTRGPRERNHCVHCHDPHAPQFPKMLPAAPPSDRFPPVTQDSRP